MFNSSKEKYSSASIVSNTTYSILSRVLPSIIALVCIPIIINRLGEEKFGVLTIAWVFIGYFNLFDLGVGKAITKLMSERIGGKQQQEIVDIYRVGLVVSALLGIFGGLVFKLLSEPITIKYLNIPSEFLDEVILGLTFLSLGIPFTILIGSVRAALEALYEFRLINIIQVLSSVATYLGIVVILYFSKNLTVLIAYLSVVKIIHFAVYFFATRLKLRVASYETKFQMGYVKELLFFGGWVSVSTIIAPFMGAIDRLVIGSKDLMSSVTYYSTASEIVQRLSFLPSAMVRVLFPVFSQNDKGEVERNGRIYRASFAGILLFAVIFSVILIAIGKDLLGVWINREFAIRSYTVLQVVAFGSVFNFVAMIPFSYIQANGEPHITAKIHLLELPVYLFLLFYLTDRFGIIGAALAGSIRMCLDFIMLKFYCYKTYNTSIDLILIIWGAIIPMGISFYLSSFDLHFGIKVLLLLVLIIVVGIGFWFKAFDEQLRDKIVSYKKSFFNG